MTLAHFDDYGEYDIALDTDGTVTVGDEWSSFSYMLSKEEARELAEKLMEFATDAA